MPKYLIRLKFTIDSIKNEEVYPVEAKTIVDAKAMATSVFYNSLKPREKMTLVITDKTHTRYKEEVEIMSNNQRRKLEKDKIKKL